MQSYNNHTYMHSYYNKCEYMQSYASTDTGLFYTILCKFLQIFHFTTTDAIALIGCIYFLLICYVSPLLGTFISLPWPFRFSIVLSLSHKSLFVSISLSL